MLQNKFERPLDLALSPSGIFYIYLIVIFVCSSIGITLSEALPVTYRLGIFILLLISFSIWLKYNLALNVINLKVNEKFEWQIESKDNESLKVELYGECIVTHFLIWLNFSTISVDAKKKKFHVLLLPDSANKDLLRQLRIRLRFSKNKTASVTELM